MSSPEFGRGLSGFIARQGVSRPLIWGFVALTLFMVGDGIELSFLSTYLTDQGHADGAVAGLFTAYGIVVALGAWLAGALAEAWGPKRVMLIGGGIWITCQLVFLLAGVLPNSFTVMVGAYAVRAIGYPLFAYGFLVWVTLSTPNPVLGKAVGWYWFFNVMGLGVISGYFVAATINHLGPVGVLFSTLAFVIAGTAIVAFLLHSQSGPRTVTAQDTLRGLTTSITILAEKPKVGIAGTVRIINTMSYYAFAVFLNIHMVKTIGFTQTEWSSIWGTMLLANIAANVISGYLSDRIGRVAVVAWAGGFGSALSVLALFYAPQLVGANVPVIMSVGIIYGFCLGMFCPLSAIVPLLAPANKAAALAVLNLGAGLSNFAGPAVAWLVPAFGVGAVMWLLAGLYILGMALTFTLRSPGIEARDHRENALTPVPEAVAV